MKEHHFPISPSSDSCSNKRGIEFAIGHYLFTVDMSLSRQIITAAIVFFFSSTAITADIDAGYDPYAAAQAMIDKASHSWEWGTAAEALLELYNSELSVFGANPFPSSKVPSANSSIFALEYAKQFINVNGQVFVDDSAVGDPASLGVSAILIGQSDSAYLDASNRQADYILNQAPRWSNGAISQRPDVAEIWADNMAMSFPFCTSSQLYILSIV